MSRPLLVLVGPPGAGKSSVALAVGARLGADVRDTDDDVVAVTGRAIADIFVDEGEEVFREHESAAVAAALAEHGGVLALGGGAVLDPRTEALLEGHTVVFLDVGIADAARRIGFGGGRPLLLGNPRAQWTSLMQTRRPVYERVATLTVDTAGRSVDEVADEVVARLSGDAP